MKKKESKKEVIVVTEEVKPSMRKQLLIPFVVLLLLFIATFFVILYGKGYRLLFQRGEPQVTKTGILHITSEPTAAQVYIDGHLTTATNNTVNLTPGKYNVKVAKDGFADWQKNVQIEKEVVTNADVFLFPKAPTLQGISTSGVEAVNIDPSGSKLAFKIASQSAQKNGIYIFDMTARNFPVLAGQSNSTQIANDTTGLFSTAQLTWAPDGKQLLASVAGELGPTYYLLKTDGFNESPQDVTATISTTTEAWHAQRQAKEAALLKSLKKGVQTYAKKNFHILAWSPDEKKILYQANTSGQMPVFLKPRRIGNNLLYERRDLKKGAVYVYNIPEDVNTRLIDSISSICTDKPTCVSPFTWFPDSNHLLYIHDKKIDIIEGDGSNQTTLYAGPFIDHYVYPWPDGSKLVILTNLNNTSVAPTLYTIGLQ